MKNVTIYIDSHNITLLQLNILRDLAIDRVITRGNQTATFDTNCTDEEIINSCVNKGMTLQEL